MPMLGDLLAAAHDSSGRFRDWLAASDAELAARVDLAAAQIDLTPTGYVRAAVADFSRYASEEDWATLTSGMRDSDDPGTVCLLAMVHWRLTAAACGSHSHVRHEDHHHAGEAHERSVTRPL